MASDPLAPLVERVEAALDDYAERHSGGTTYGAAVIAVRAALAALVECEGVVEAVAFAVVRPDIRPLVKTDPDLREYYERRASDALAALAKLAEEGT